MKMRSAFIAPILLRLKRIFFNLDFFSTPSGCGVNVSIMKNCTLKKDMYDIQGLAYWSGKIELWAKVDAPIEDIEEILNHEVLHVLLARVDGVKAYTGLDNVQMFKKGRIIFYSIRDGKELSK